MGEGDLADRREDSGLRRRTVLVGGVGLAALGATGCTLKDESYRYRMSIEVEISGQRYVGQGVREFLSRDVIAFPNPGSTYNNATLGDAIWIDVPGAATLFVLLRQAIYGSGDIWDPGPFLGRGGNGIFGLRAKAQGRVWVPAQDLPTIVVFDDVSDSTTMRLVHPGQVKRVLGSDAYISNAWIERTSDPVTRGIEAKLPCLVPLVADPKVRGRMVTIPGELTFNVPDFHN